VRSFEPHQDTRDRLVPTEIIPAYPILPLYQGDMCIYFSTNVQETREVDARTHHARDSPSRTRDVTTAATGEGNGWLGPTSGEPGWLTSMAVEIVILEFRAQIWRGCFQELSMATRILVGDVAVADVRFDPTATRCRGKNPSLPWMTRKAWANLHTWVPEPWLVNPNARSAVSQSQSPAVRRPVGRSKAGPDLFSTRCGPPRVRQFAARLTRTSVLQNGRCPRARRSQVRLQPPGPLRRPRGV